MLDAIYYSHEDMKRASEDFSREVPIGTQSNRITLHWFREQRLDFTKGVYMLKTSVQDRIRQALDTVEYNNAIKAYVISAKYWEGLEPDTFNCYSNFRDLKIDLIKELTRRWG